jgi:hypothetical protein
VAKYVCPYCAENVPIKPDGKLLFHTMGDHICAGVRFQVSDSELRAIKKAQASKINHGICPSCGRNVALKADNHLRSHNDATGRHCVGSGAKAAKIIGASGRKKPGTPGGSSSVRTVQGGLPGLGRQH